MTGNQPEDPEGHALLAFLAAQRGAVLSIVAGLDEEAWQRPAVPSGRPPYDPEAAFVCDRPSAEVISYYRDQCARSDAVLAVTPLSAPPCGRHGDLAMDEPPDVRWAVPHMIEETARHAGHLDIARELADGQTGLGPR